MRLGPVIHGGLLLVALLFAYQTSTRSKTKKPKQGTHLVWKESKPTSLVFESEESTVRMEWREDEKGKYLWGHEDRSRVVKKKLDKPVEPAEPVEGTPADAAKDKAPAEEPKDGTPADASADEAKEEAPAEEETIEETVVTTHEYPIGTKGSDLLKEYEKLMALRKVGPITSDDFEKYDLQEKTLNLTVAFADGKQRTLLIASKSIYGGGDRYALDVQSNILYVLAGKLVKPLESAETSLGLDAVHTYKDEFVKSVEVKTTAGDKEILKGSTTDEKGQHTTWSSATSPGQNDTTLGTFIERVGKLKPAGYEPKLQAGDLIHIATLRYRDDKKQALGYLELYRQLPTMQEPSTDPKLPNQTQYYIKTEETRVLGKVGRLAGQQIDRDLVEFFGITPPPVDPEIEVEAPKPPGPTDPMELPVLPPMGGH